MAEWLGRALQKLVQRFEPARDLIARQIDCLAFFIGKHRPARLSAIFNQNSGAGKFTQGYCNRIFWHLDGYFAQIQYGKGFHLIISILNKAG